ncbi:MAG: Na/Pi cotransporter family protein [Victivallales bacterium]|nr:Na/Pi cotransporter family protein [Victivallales bacterium]
MTFNDYFEMFYKLIGGLGLFLFGMNLLSQGLQTLGSSVIKNAINYITANRVCAVLVGCLVTMFVQSSSVSTVMMSSFVNAGLMTLTQGAGFILGANIGTTITGWIISLKIGKYGLLLIGIGALPMLFSSNNKIKSVGRLLFSLGLLFFGLEFMSAAFEPLRSNQEFMHMTLTYFSANSRLSVLTCMGIGCLLTMIIQSSSAMLGITIALATTGAIEFPTAAALVLGENIGTTITLWFASIGAQTVTKRIALAHTLFNAIGCLLVFLIFPYYIEIIKSMVPGTPVLPVDTLDTKAMYAAEESIKQHIAMTHTVFNVSMTIIFLPFLQYLIRLVSWIIPEPREKEKENFTYFGNIRNMSTVLAIQEARLVTNRMAEKTRIAINMSGEYLASRELKPELSAKVKEIEDITDVMQKEITLFLSKVMLIELNEQQIHDVNAMTRICDELESICDYCYNIVKYRERLAENDIPLKKESRETLTRFIAQVEDFFKSAQQWIKDEEAENLSHFNERYSELNKQADEIRNYHLAMIKNKKYPPLFGLTFSDIMIALRRIKNHTLNIGEAVCGERGDN